jgi:hypothetical protein
MDAEFAFERRTTALQRTDDVGGDTVGTPVITITAPNDWNQKEERAALGNAEAEFAAAFGDDASDLVLHDRIGLGQHDARHKRQVVTDRVGFCEQTVARYQRARAVRRLVRIDPMIAPAAGEWSLSLPRSPFQRQDSRFGSRRFSPSSRGVAPTQADKPTRAC